MPAKLRECVYKGQKGYASDKGGKCFVGSGAREKAVEQVQAINIAVGIKEGATWAENLKKTKS